MADIYILLKRGGYLKWTGVDEVRLEPKADAAQYYLGETYRDTGFAISPTTGGFTSVSAPAVDGQSASTPVAYRNPDEIEHKEPRTKAPFVSMVWGYLSGTKVKTYCVPLANFNGTSTVQPYA